MNRNILWKKDDVIKVVQMARGVDGKIKSKIIRSLSAQCHDASPLHVSREDIGDCITCAKAGTSACDACINGNRYLKAIPVDCGWE